MTESELRREVVELAHKLGWRVFSLPIAKTRRPVKDAVGYPDLTLARDGTVVWIELKQDDGRVSDAQIAWMNALHPAMHIVRPGDWERGTVYGMLR